jgi:hypothetical protein
LHFVLVQPHIQLVKCIASNHDTDTGLVDDRGLFGDVRSVNMENTFLGPTHPQGDTFTIHFSRPA